MKKLLISALLMAMCFSGKAQQVAQVSHFMNDHLRTNPGSAGSMDMVSISAIMRDQMVGFQGNPKNFFFNVEAPFSLLGTKHGAGLSMFSDAIGLNTDINLQLSYAYRFVVGDGTLGIGADVGFIQNQLAFQDFNPSVEGDLGYPQGDPDGMTLTMGAGLFYRTEEIYFGASVIHLNEPKVTTTPEGTQINDANYNLSRQYYVTAGYSVQLSNPAWEIKPGVLLKSDGRATDMDLNLTCLYNKKIWGGVSYRTGAAVVGMVGLELMEGLKVGFAYDAETSALMKYSNVSYEIFVNYSFKIGVEKAPQKYKSIRFL